MDLPENNYYDMVSDFDDRIEDEQVFILEDQNEKNHQSEEDDFYRHLEEY